jgi:ubiquinol-cytochrome c reductase cytochrome c1 subunit
MKKLIANLIAGVATSLVLLMPAHASGGDIHLDTFPQEKMKDQAALQRGAKMFVNYCLNCHAAAFMRYNRMRDLGLTEADIKKNLMYATEKVGDTMNISMDARQAKEWFGGTPPDLTVIARSRAGDAGSGADYLYTYLRGYYLDATKATGWNNTAFPSVAMPHVLWELQGQRKAVFEEQPDPHDAAKKVHVLKSFEQVTPGTMAPAEFDSAVGDLVAFLQWMGEPAQDSRVKLGMYVMAFLALFSFLTWRLNSAFWKDIK